MPRPRSALVLTLALFAAGAVQADPLRLATYHAGLGQKGPGVLISKILKGERMQMS